MAYVLDSTYYFPDNVPRAAPRWEHSIYQIRQRLLWLRNDYRRLSQEYKALSLSQKRDIRSELAMEMFAAAAIFEGIESGVLHERDPWDMLSKMPPSVLAHCPIAMDWFEDLQKLHAVDWKSDFEKSMIALANAEWKRLQAEKLLQIIRNSTPPLHEAPQETVLRAWTALCEEIRIGKHSFEAALNTARIDFWAEPEKEPEQPQPGFIQSIINWWAPPPPRPEPKKPEMHWFRAEFIKDPVWPSAEPLPPIWELDPRPRAWDYLTQPPPQYEQVLRKYALRHHLWYDHYNKPSQAELDRRAESARKRLIAQQCAERIRNVFKKRTSKRTPKQDNQSQNNKKSSQKPKTHSQYGTYGQRSGQTPSPTFKAKAKPKSTPRAKTPHCKPSTAKKTFNNPPGMSYQQAFDEYNKRWAALKPHEKTFPYPSRTLQHNALVSTLTIKYNATRVSLWTPTQIITINTQLFFLSAFAIPHQIMEDSKGRPFVSITPGSDKTAVGKLLKHLRLKETGRWHPDKLNRRTGVAGGEPDEGISKAEGVKAIWAGIEGLVEVCKVFR